MASNKPPPPQFVERRSLHYLSWRKANGGAGSELWHIPDLAGHEVKLTVETTLHIFAPLIPALAADEAKAQQTPNYDIQYLMQHRAQRCTHETVPCRADPITGISSCAVVRDLGQRPIVSEEVGKQLHDDDQRLRGHWAFDHPGSLSRAPVSTNGAEFGCAYVPAASIPPVQFV